MTKEVTNIKFMDFIDFLSKVDEHKQLFPLADLAGQVMKLEEELLEFQQAETNEEKIKELADCVICCIGIFRFAPLVSKSYIAHIFSRIRPDTVQQVVEAVNTKWQINLNRTWEYKDGKYHHI